MMGIEAAISIFRSQFKDKKIIGYYKYEKYVVIITKFDGKIESNYYIVIDKEHILPTNPIMIDLDEKKVVYI